MKIGIKSWGTRSILFECESVSLKLAVELAVIKQADLQGADLQGAYLQGADLQGADLKGAYLRGAHLRGVDLQGVDLQGTYLNGEKLNKAPLMMQGFKWDILISKKQILIGCQTHEAEKWFNFKDAEIEAMHSDALDWWNDHKKLIQSAWELHCKD